MVWLLQDHSQIVAIVRGSDGHTCWLLPNWLLLITMLLDFIGIRARSFVPNISFGRRFLIVVVLFLSSDAWYRTVLAC